MSSNNGTPASTAGGESLSPSNQSRFVLRSSLYASPSRSGSKTEDAVDTNVDPPKDSALSSNATDEYIGSTIDGSKVSSSNVILATSKFNFKFNGSPFSVASIEVFSYIVSVIVIIGLMTLRFVLSPLGAAFSSLGTACTAVEYACAQAAEYRLQMLLEDTNVVAASTEVPEKTAPGATASATGALGSTPAAASPFGTSADNNAFDSPTSDSSFGHSAYIALRAHCDSCSSIEEVSK